VKSESHSMMRCDPERGSDHCLKSNTILCECRIATGKATTGAGDNDTPVQPQPFTEGRTTQWGRRHEIRAGVELPWSLSQKAA